MCSTIIFLWILMGIISVGIYPNLTKEKMTPSFACFLIVFGVGSLLFSFIYWTIKDTEPF